MSPLVEAKLAVPSSLAAPDSHVGPIGVPPGPTFVVSRSEEGAPLSTYADMVWDWQPYTAIGRSSVLNFRFWNEGPGSEVQTRLVDEMRWLMFLLVWRRQGRAFSYQTLLHYLKTMRAMARYCNLKGSSIAALLGSEKQLVEFVRNASDGQVAKNTASLLNLLGKMGASEVGYKVMGKKTYQTLRGLAQAYSNSLKQHPPLPTRVYALLLSALLQEIEDFAQVKERYLAMVGWFSKNPIHGRCMVGQYRAMARLGVKDMEVGKTFSDVLNAHDLREYFEAKALQANLKGLSRGLYTIQTALRLTVQAFTGMRDEEVAALPYDCLETQVSNGITHHLIAGKTTKLNHGNIKRTRWVTSREGHLAVTLAKELADAIYAHTRQPTRLVIGDDLPLFVSPVYLQMAGRKSTTSSKPFLPSKLDLGKCYVLRHKLQPPIQEEDLVELEQIDPHRPWRAEPEFQVGLPWVLTSHQLRRSLALYAQRSGLVSLPSLRRQLQHITEEMSRYYARGSAFAENFLDDNKDHFGQEWRDTQPVSAALSYMLNVLKSDDVLFGGHANWVDARIRDTSGQVVVNRESTLRLFKKGEMAYRETILGGCTNPDQCDQLPVKWLDVDCLGGCRNLVGRLSRLERVIEAQTRFVDSLREGTPEHTAETADLNTLIAARTRVLDKQESI